jgi:RNA polymerase sigma-70 factor (ECF subfamily)
MSDGSTAEFVRRIRAGDEEAAAELVRQYEPLIRREIRLGLTEPMLCRVLDSMDICQSVMASFFVQAACGRYDLEEPGQVIKLLIGMARNKLAFAARRERAQRRDVRRLEAVGVDELNPADAAAASPSQIVAGRDLLRAVRERLSADERQLAERRALGQDWAGIAAEMGGTAEGRRHQLTRALDRVAEQLGLNE